MILRAAERCVPEAQIAAARNVDVALIRRKSNLLNGICAEAVESLRRDIARSMVSGLCAR